MALLWRRFPLTISSRGRLHLPNPKVAPFPSLPPKSPAFSPNRAPLRRLPLSAPGGGLARGPPPDLPPIASRLLLPRPNTPESCFAGLEISFPAERRLPTPGEVAAEDRLFTFSFSRHSRSTKVCRAGPWARSPPRGSAGKALAPPLSSAVKGLRPPPSREGRDIGDPRGAATQRGCHRVDEGVPRAPLRRDPFKRSPALPQKPI